MKVSVVSKLLASLFVLGVLSGCSASGPKYSEYQSSVATVEADKSRVFFFRQKKFMSGGVDAQIEINGNDVGECANDGYFFVDVNPGLLNITADVFMSPGEHTMQLQVEPGSETYVEVLVDEDYVSSGIILGAIGQAAYVSNNENAGPWILREKAASYSQHLMRDMAFSKD